VPVRGIREIHDVTVSSVHGVIRLVNRVASDTVDVVLDVIEQRKEPGAAPAVGTDSTPP
jgi:hypothetical protein